MHVTSTCSCSVYTTESCVSAGPNTYARGRFLKNKLKKEILFEEWCVMQCAEKPQFKYGELKMQLKLMVLQFVWSIWAELLPIAPLHIRDMVTLPNNHPETDGEFKKVHFPLQKMKNAFFVLAMNWLREMVVQLGWPRIHRPLKGGWFDGCWAGDIMSRLHLKERPSSQNPQNSWTIR